ncbi:unnamed protein product [Ranitomeya imitator]|uniref:Uncharacterized protein n=1 Tax=Ranitomeya imitator TaxID=111125 RepID=A0ABN9L3W3_9NEOB|nr:unnamed protein product [Ranitomeya imitator]
MGGRKLDTGQSAGQRWGRVLDRDGAECWTEMGQSAGQRWGRVLDRDGAECWAECWTEMGQSAGQRWGQSAGQRWGRRWGRVLDRDGAECWTEMGQSAGQRWGRVLDRDGAECWTEMGQSAGQRWGRVLDRDGAGLETDGAGWIRWRQMGQDGEIIWDRSGREDMRDGGKIMSSDLSTLSLRKREEKKEDMADRHSGILESRELLNVVWSIWTRVRIGLCQQLFDQTDYGVTVLCLCPPMVKFRWFYLQAKVVQSFEHLGQVLQVVLISLVEDDDIVQVQQDSFEVLVLETALHHTLKRSWGVAQSEQHVVEFTETHRCGEGRLFLIRFCYRNLPVPTVPGPGGVVLWKSHHPGSVRRPQLGPDDMMSPPGVRHPFPSLHSFRLAPPTKAHMTRFSGSVRPVRDAKMSRPPVPVDVTVATRPVALGAHSGEILFPPSIPEDVGHALYLPPLSSVEVFVIEFSEWSFRDTGFLCE